MSLISTAQNARTCCKSGLTLVEALDDEDTKYLVVFEAYMKAGPELKERDCSFRVLCSDQGIQAFFDAPTPDYR